VRPTEDLIDVPAEVVFIGHVLNTLGRINFFAVFLKKPFEMQGGPIYILSNKEPEICIHVDDALVEHLVMEGAKSKSVRDEVGTVVLIPLNVSRLQGEWGAIHTEVESADGTSIIVCLQHILSKGRIATRLV